MGTVLWRAVSLSLRHRARSAELQARDDVILVASHDDRLVDWLVEPIVFYQVLPHVCRIPRGGAAGQRFRDPECETERGVCPMAMPLPK
ncbi:hypothetical protein EVAR_56082_1 [Eumeta japonica]|uniref:Uncharacterized protein n=1 Tax=Eumeta variegata TaxID=151549 RepID=A0A4C1YM20_EUMVA|nr:hypothetical protein EVAR_56082_1 [Eumeta japonica]